MTAQLTRGQARRIALAAQGLGRRPSGPVTMRHLQGVLDRVAQFQIDSVNVAVRAHYQASLVERGFAMRVLLQWDTGYIACGLVVCADALDRDPRVAPCHPTDGDRLALPFLRVAIALR